MKSIEAGCLAIVIADEDVRNIGKEVTVHSFANIASRKKGANMWKVVSTRKLYVYNERLNKTREINNGICFESNLMRVDGGEPKDVIDIRINFLEISGVRTVINSLHADEREVDWTKLHEYSKEEKEVDDMNNELDSIKDDFQLDKEIEENIRRIEDDHSDLS